jgi:hypothetical protein
MKRLLIFSALIISAAALAQKPVVPGYLGKRLYIGVNGSTFMHFERDLLDQVNLGNFPMNTRFSYKTEVTASYALNRKVSVGVTGTYAQQKAYFGILGVKVLRPGFTDTIVDNIMPVSPGTELGRYRYNFYSVQAHIQIFRRNFIAPAGRYHYFGIGYLGYVPVMEQEGVIVVQPVDAAGQEFGASYTQNVPNLGKYGTFRITYLMGRITPINKFLFINTSFGINFYPGGDHAEAFINSGNNTVATFQDAFVSTLHRNLVRHNTFELKVGLGWFAF